MSKGKKTAIIVSIACLILVGIVAILFCVQKWGDVPDDGNPDSSDKPTPEPEITREISLNSGVKSEYYLGEEINVNDMSILLVTTIDGKSENEIVNCSYSFIKGYPEVPLPNTNELGMHSFTLNYLGAECLVTYNVVEYNEEHVLELVNRNIYFENNSMFVLLDRDVKGDAKEYVTDIYKKLIYDDVTGSGPLSYLKNIENAIKISNDSSSLSIFNHRTDTSKTANINKTDNMYNGVIWVVDNEQDVEVSFELVYYAQTKGIKLILTAKEKTYTILLNSTETTFNMAISGISEYDILLNYGIEKMYLTTTSEGENSNLYSQDYSSTFASVGTQVLEYNVNTESYNFN